MDRHRIEREARQFSRALFDITGRNPFMIVLRVSSLALVLISISILIAGRFVVDLQTVQTRTIGVYAIFFGLFVFFTERFLADDAKNLLIYPNHKPKPLLGVIIGALISAAIGGVVVMMALALINWPIDLLVN